MSAKWTSRPDVPGHYWFTVPSGRNYGRYGPVLVTIIEESGPSPCVRPALAVKGDLVPIFLEAKRGRWYGPIEPPEIE